MDVQRIFVAIDISEKARNAAARHIDGLRQEFRDIRVGWERTEKLHLTLKFIGDTDEREALADAMKSVARMFDPFVLTIAETGVFPSARRPRILWLGATDETGTVNKIRQLIETECEKRGFKRDERPFDPHLTIARLREPQRSRKLVERHLAASFDPVKFVVPELVIYESKLLPAGSEYLVVSRVEFGIKPIADN